MRVHEVKQSVRLLLLSGSFVGPKLLQAIRRTGQVQVAGVFWDDPSLACSNSYQRFWRYGYSSPECLGLPHAAQAAEILCFSGNLKDNAAVSFLRTSAPDICLMASFGQFIPRALREIPRLGFWNVHPDAPGETSQIQFPGPTPYEDLLAAGHRSVAFAMHRVTKQIDGGEVIARSNPFPISTRQSIRSIRRRLAASEAAFAAHHLRLLCLQARFGEQVNESVSSPAIQGALP